MIEVFGPMDVARHTRLKEQGIDLRVFIDGQDVTDSCCFADDTPGKQLVQVFRRNPQGRVVAENGDPVVDTRYGHVEFCRRA